MYLLTVDFTSVIINTLSPSPSKTSCYYAPKRGTAMLPHSDLEVVGKTFSTDMVIAAHAIA